MMLIGFFLSFFLYNLAFQEAATITETCLTCSNCVPEMMKSAITSENVTKFQNWRSYNDSEGIEDIAYEMWEMMQYHTDDMMNFTTIYAAFDNSDFYIFTNCRPNAYGSATRANKLYCMGAGSYGNWYSFGVRNDKHFETHTDNMFYMFVSDAGILDWNFVLNDIVDRDLYNLPNITYDARDRPYYKNCKTEGWTDAFEFPAGGFGVAYVKNISVGVVGIDITSTECPDQFFNDTRNATKNCTGDDCCPDGSKPPCGTCPDGSSPPCKPNCIPGLTCATILFPDWVWYAVVGGTGGVGFVVILGLLLLVVWVTIGARVVMKRRKKLELKEKDNVELEEMKKSDLEKDVKDGEKGKEDKTVKKEGDEKTEEKKEVIEIKENEKTEEKKEKTEEKKEKAIEEKKEVEKSVEKVEEKKEVEKEKVEKEEKEVEKSVLEKVEEVEKEEKEEVEEKEKEEVEEKEEKDEKENEVEQSENKEEEAEKKEDKKRIQKNKNM